MATLTVELPDAIAEALAAHIAQTVGSSSDKAVAGALALWLLQQGQDGSGLRQAYLAAAFPIRDYSGADAA